LIDSSYSGGALLELLPDLPQGRFRIDAVLTHKMANGLSWVGVYAAGSHWATARGRQHFFVTAKYADLGLFAADGPPHCMRGRRTHLMGMYLGDSDRSPVVSTQDFAPHPDGHLVVPPAPGRRTVSLIVDGGRVWATQQAGESVGELGNVALDAIGRKAVREHPDLADGLAIRPHGGVGLFVCNASVTIDQFQITPLGAPK
jgi:hypothetical protein